MGRLLDMVMAGTPIVPSIPGVYEPSPWQCEFHQTRVDVLLGAGSAGPGKSLCLLMDPVDIVLLEHERMVEGRIRKGDSVAKMLFLRRELQMLGETVERAHRIFHHIDPKVHYRNDGRHVFTFTSGAKFILGGCKDPDDWKAYQGDQYVWQGFDEVTQFGRNQFDQIQARLRTSDGVLAKLLRVRCCSNPEAGWVRDEFVDPEPAGRQVIVKRMKRGDGTFAESTRMYLPAVLYDNPDKDFVAQYEVKLMSLPIVVRNAYLKADWYATADSFFGEDWDPRHHVIKPFRVPGHWPRFRAMDWGFKTHGAIYWLAVAPDGELIVIKEYWFRKKTAGQVADEIKRIELELGVWNKKTDRSSITGPADTQLWEERGESAVTKAQEMAAKGVPWVRANKKSRSGNALRVLTKLRDRRGDFPGLCFFDTCRQAIRTIPTIKVDPDDTEAPLKGPDDHGYDAISYACSHQVPPPRDDDDTFEGPEAKRRHAADGGDTYAGAIPWT